MPIRVARTFTVPAPAPAVLDYLADFTHTEEWDPATVRTTRNGHGWHNESRVLGLRIELTYQLCERGPDRLVFAGRNEGATSTDTITVRPVEGGAEVTYELDLEMHGVAKLATPVMRLEFEKLADRLVVRMTAALSRLTAPESESWDQAR